MTPALLWCGRVLMLAVRFLLWLTDMDDGKGSIDWRETSPSATKILGAASVVVGLWIMAASKKADGAAVGLVALGMTAVFGRSMWKLWLGRNTWTNAISASASYARTHTITEHRGGDVWKDDERGDYTDRSD